MSQKKYELTAEHRAQLDPHAKKWIARAMSTTPITETEKSEAVQAVLGLYAAAKLSVVPRVVFAPSPVLAEYASGVAAALIYELKDLKREGPMTSDYADFSKSGTQHQLVANLICAAVGIPPIKVPDREDTTPKDQWYRFDTGSVRAAVKAILKELGREDLESFCIECAKVGARLKQGGNTWAGWASFISFFREVAELDKTHGVNYNDWIHWEKLAATTGPRWVHEQFCVISDKPTILQVDEQNRPHNNSGPFARWSDGTELYTVHGVRLASYIVRNPETIMVSAIEAESNAEIRRIMVNKYGMSKYLLDSNAQAIHKDARGTLYRKEQRGDDPILMVHVINSTAEPDGTFREFFLQVPHDAGIKTATDAVKWTFDGAGLDFEYAPSVET